ncbi:MAG: proline dehydrogenase family protein [Candidatus Marinimicrobia bacterium]|jgi:proline dehydrogenase|nr:proline dehydrogenase family protein [Candidatus Neomarinimicrobiota bacterium]
MKLINYLIIQIIPFLPKIFVRLVASPYIAGITDDQMLINVKKLNDKGYDVAIDILGEHVTTDRDATQITERYANLYDRIASQGLDANLSIKLSHIGQDLGYELVRKNLMILVNAAKKHNNFLRLDMENSPYTSETINLYKKAFEIYPNVGIVLQAYMHRSIDDIDMLANKVFNVRICKGIYIESEDIAYRGYEKIRNNYIALVQRALTKGSYVGIASHDEYLIDTLYAWIKDNKISPSQYEFQVLHGVPMEKKLQQLIKEGNKVRVYVPYGDNWYDYSVRRLKENPKMAGYIIKNIFSKIFNR